MKTHHARAAFVRRKLGQASLSALLSAFGAVNSTAALQPGQTPASFDAEVIHKVHLDYLAYVPEAAAQSTDKKWPAILFLHGSGERGTNLLDVTKHGPPKIVKDKRTSASSSSRPNARPPSAVGTWRR